jgi:hypothetical protein
MLASRKLAADFSRGRADRGIGRSLFATHPHLYSIREWLPAGIASGDSRHSESPYSPPPYLVADNKPRARE